MLAPLMLMMRLQRVGRRNDPSYRIVVTDKRTGPKSDKHVDRLGSYDPRVNHINIDVEKAKEWISKGVRPSETMHNLLVSQNLIEGEKVNVLPKKSPIIDEEAVKEEEKAEETTEEDTDSNSEEVEDKASKEETKTEDNEAPAKEEKEEDEKSVEEKAEESKGQEETSAEESESKNPTG